MREPTATALLSFCLVANLLPLMTFPAILPVASTALGLSTAEAGWVGGIYFAGYTSAVFTISSLTDRYNPKYVYIACALLGAGASAVFALFVDGFWSALLARFVGGVGVAGIHMPGLVLLRALVNKEPSGRSTGIYASCYAHGNAASFVVAGLIDEAFGWRATFLAAACGPLLAGLLIGLAPMRRSQQKAIIATGFAPLLKNRALMTYVIAFAGNAWEVFAIRVWFVAYLTWVLERPGGNLDLPALALVSGLAALVGVPASIAIAELAARSDRRRTIRWICWVSVGVCAALAMATGAPSSVVLGLLIVLQITSFADVGALTAGAANAAEPDRKGASLGHYAGVGFLAGWLGPVTVGVTLGWLGMTPIGWAMAFAVIGLGSLLAGTMMCRAAR
jgi:MFS family permease